MKKNHVYSGGKDPIDGVSNTTSPRSRPKAELRNMLTIKRSILQKIAFHIRNRNVRFELREYRENHIKPYHQKILGDRQNEPAISPGNSTADTILLQRQMHYLSIQSYRKQIRARSYG